MIQLKAPYQRVNGHCGKIVRSITVSKVKNSFLDSILPPYIHSHLRKVDSIDWDLLKQRFVAVYGCDYWRKNAAGCVWIQLLVQHPHHHPRGRCWGENTALQLQSLWPTQSSLHCLCGNKLTGKVNIQVWREPLPLVVSSVTHSPAWFNCHFKSRIQAVNLNISQQRWKIMTWEVMCEQRAAPPPPVKEFSGAEWPLEAEITEEKAFAHTRLNLSNLWLWPSQSLCLILNFLHPHFLLCFSHIRVITEAAVIAGLL